MQVASWALPMVLPVFFVVAILILLVLVPPIYRQRRRAATRARGPLPPVPARLLAGAERTWVVFTTPYCASVGSVEAQLRAHDPGARLVEIDATLEPGLAQAFDVRRAPTVLLADAAGKVKARLVGTEGVDAYVRNPK
jgi:hypothetical protein